MKRFITCLLFFFCAFFSWRPASAEFLCSADIRYKWRLINPSNEIPKVPSKGKDQPNDGADDGKLNEKDREIDVFWQMVEAKGETEEEAKLNLKVLINDRRSKADAACREQHENQSSCLANKFAQSAALQNTLTFSQRKELEKKMIADCEIVAGSCLGSASTEPSCREVVAQAPKAEAAETKGKEKDAKKK